MHEDIFQTHQILSDNVGHHAFMIGNGRSISFELNMATLCDHGMTANVTISHFYDGEIVASACVSVGALQNGYWEWLDKQYVITELKTYTRISHLTGVAFKNTDTEVGVDLYPEEIARFLRKVNDYMEANDA